jgi:hypothetical protein
LTMNCDVIVTKDLSYNYYNAPICN